MPIRRYPNVAITGVPGGGKSTLALALLERLNSVYSLSQDPSQAQNRPEQNYSQPVFTLHNPSAGSFTASCRTGWDDHRQAWIIDEDRLADILHPHLSRGGVILDWIHADMLATESSDSESNDHNFLDLVVTMRCENSVLFNRYKSRGYSEDKVQENLDAEIMNVVGEENREVFDKTGTLVVELRGEEGEGEENVRRVVEWVACWMREHPVEEDVEVKG